MLASAPVILLCPVPAEPLVSLTGASPSTLAFPRKRSVNLAHLAASCSNIFFLFNLNF